MKLRKPRNPVSQYAHKRKAGPHIDRKKEENKNKCRKEPPGVCAVDRPDKCLLGTANHGCGECPYYEGNNENND